MFIDIGFSQVNEYKSDIDRLSQELHHAKKRYYEQKRREAMPKDSLVERMIQEANDPALEQISIAKAANQKYIGGGFAIK